MRLIIYCGSLMIIWRRFIRLKATILLTPARCEAKERALSVPFLMMFARVVLAFGFFKTARLMAKLNGFMLVRPIAARPLPAS